MDMILKYLFVLSNFTHNNNNNNNNNNKAILLRNFTSSRTIQGFQFVWLYFISNQI